MPVPGTWLAGWEQTNKPLETVITANDENEYNADDNVSYLHVYIFTFSAECGKRMYVHTLGT